MHAENQDTQEAAGGPEVRAGAGHPASGVTRRLTRTMFHPELGSSVAAMRESGRTLGAIVVAARESVRRDMRVGGRPRAGIGLTGWLLVGAAVACVAYGVAVLLGGLLLIAIPRVHGQALDSGILGGADEKTRELLHFLHEIGRGEGFGLGEMLRYFNAAVLVVVAVVLIYQVLFAVVETGRTGEARLTGWQVMRLVIGVGLIFPLPATGLGPGQHLFLALTDVSGNVAAGVWGRFANLIVGGGPGGPVRIPPRHRDLVVKMIVMHTCMYVHNQVAAAAGDDPYITVQKKEYRDEVHYLYRDPMTQGRYRACGMVSVTKEPAVDNAGARIMARAHLEALRSDEFVAGLDRAARDLGDRYLATSPLSGEPLPEVNEWLDGVGLVRLYSAQVQSQLAAAAAASREALNDEVARAIESEGWLSAASFLLAVSRNQAMFHDALRAIPQAMPGSRWGENALVAMVKPWREAGVDLERWLTGSEVVVESGRVTPVHAQGWWSRLLNVIPVDQVAFLDDGSPLESLVGMGHAMVTGALVVLVGGEVVSFMSAPGRWLATFVAGATMERVGGLVTLAAYGILFAGLVLAYILPLIPFLRFFFGVVSWVISVVTGLIAIPLFLTLQMGAEGRGLVSEASRGGYLLILHAVARPALMVLGLVFGYFVFVAAMELFNWLYVAHLEGLSNATRMGVVTAVVSLLIYAIVAYAIANASFKAIDVVPQELMRWLGGRVRSGDDEVAGMARTVGETMTVAAALRGAGRVTRAK